LFAACQFKELKPTATNQFIQFYGNSMRVYDTHKHSSFELCSLYSAQLKQLCFGQMMDRVQKKSVSGINVFCTISMYDAGNEKKA